MDYTCIFSVFHIEILQQKQYQDLFIEVMYQYGNGYRDTNHNKKCVSAKKKKRLRNLSLMRETYQNWICIDLALIGCYHIIEPTKDKILYIIRCIFFAG